MSTKIPFTPNSPGADVYARDKTYRRDSIFVLGRGWCNSLNCDDRIDNGSLLAAWPKITTSGFFKTALLDEMYGAIRP